MGHCPGSTIHVNDYLHHHWAFVIVNVRHQYWVGLTFTSSFVNINTINTGRKINTAWSLARLPIMFVTGAVRVTINGSSMTPYPSHATLFIVATIFHHFQFRYASSLRHIVIAVIIDCFIADAHYRLHVYLSFRHTHTLATAAHRRCHFDFIATVFRCHFHYIDAAIGLLALLSSSHCRHCCLRAYITAGLGWGNIDGSTMFSFRLKAVTGPSISRQSMAFHIDTGLRSLRHASHIDTVIPIILSVDLLVGDYHSRCLPRCSCRHMMMFDAVTSLLLFRARAALIDARHADACYII